MRNGSSGGVALLIALSATLTAAPARAQREQPLPPPPAPVTATPPPAPPAGSPLAAAAATDTSPLPVPTDLLKVQPGGITADAVGRRAAATSWSAKAAMETLRAAAARVDSAWAAFLPRLSGVARYTRLSGFTPPSFGSGSLVGTNAPPGPPINPADVANGSVFLVPVSLTFPLVLDNYLLQATINVPISDYFLRIDQVYTSATRSQDAARWDAVTARAVAEANGRIIYYTWLNARGAVIVATEALNVQRTHLRDARNQFTVGNASKADVLRAETAVASAELALERAKNLADLSEAQLRVAIHARDEEVITPGEDLESPVVGVQGNVQQMTLEALSARPEVKSADANAAAARLTSEAQKAGRYPNLSAFADGIYANPNPRFFPATQDWNATWDLGAQITWSPNDIPTANGGAADFAARAAAIEANKNVTRDNIQIEVTQDLQAVHEADFSIESSTRELASAEEAYRVARELFNNGRGTSTTLTDAESDLTRARLDLLNAKVAARTARIRLEHALGRDAHAVQ